MSSSFFLKLKALMKKNLILMKRNLLFTLIEIFFPVLLFIILVILRESLEREVTTFEESWQNDTFNYTDNYFISSITNGSNQSEFNFDDLENITWNDFHIIHPLFICSQFNFQNQARKKIASIKVPKEIKDQIIRDNQLTYDMMGLHLSYDSFIEFDSVEDMENHIKSEEYFRDKNNLICFGIKFLYDEDTKKYDYSLHFFDYEKVGKEGIQDISCNMKGMFDKFQIGHDLHSFSYYKNGAYSYIMKVINQYILRKETKNKKAELNFGIIPMKYIDYRYDGFLDFDHIIIIIIHIAYMIPLTFYVYKIVAEKESRIKEGMKIMGLKETEYFLSYFLQYFIISIVISFINSLLLKVVFIRIPFSVLYFLIFLFSLNIFALIYFFQSFMDNTKNAIIVTLFFYLLMYCTYLVCMNEDTSKILKTILSIIPSVSICLGILLLQKFQVHFKNFKIEDISINHFNYSIKTMYIMLTIDFFLYLALGYYLYNVCPHELGIRKPWYFLCTSEYWRKLKRKKIEKIKSFDIQVEDTKFLSDNENSINNYKNKILLKEKEFEEDIYDIKNKKENDTVEIKNIVKIFEDGKKAVDKVNLTLYKNEIFALLGHNGAGKTTLISMLTGTYEATEGEVIYDGVNILDSQNMDLFREKIGICTQYDTLYDYLTIREHLELFSIFKGVKPDKIDEEINKILHDFQFENNADMIVKNLSTGQKRKLSVAISLIGGSEIIFLDEPSSGIDITSRRNLWDILKHLSEGKIIIITTHYMEEASILGNRIGIISLGHMKCIGSPLFLIEKYGKYMNLNVFKEEDADDNAIVDFILNQAENVEYEVLSEEIMFRIPVKDTDIAEVKLLDISQFFRYFDENMYDLRIKSYSVSMPTLEDVFLNIGAEEKLINEYDKKNEDENDIILFEKNLKEKYSPKEKFINDFMINMKRRYLIMIRDTKGIMLEVIGPILLVLIGLVLSTTEKPLRSFPSVIDFNITGKQNIIFSSMLSETNIPSYFINDSELVHSQQLKNFPTYNDKKQAILDFNDAIFEIMKNEEQSEHKELDMFNASYIGYYSSMLILEEDEIKNKYQFIISLNSRVKQCIPIYLPLLLKSVIEKAAKKKINIKYTHSPMPLTYDIKDEKFIGCNYAVMFFLSAALSIMPINYIFHLVKERINNSKHLMRISSVNIASYWIVNYIFEIIKYYFTGGLCILLLYIFKFYKEYLFIFYITLGPGMVSLTYIMSFFLDESNAQNAVILVNFIIGNIGAITVLFLRSINSLKNFAKFIEYILAFIPAFCFDFSLNLLINATTVYYADYPDEFLTFGSNVVITKFNLLLSMILYSSLECILYAVLLVYIERRTYLFKKSSNVRLESYIEEKGVIEEIEKCNNNYISISGEYNITSKMIGNNEELENENENDNYILRIQNLKKIYKLYNVFCRNKENVMALKNINFCLKRGECFGLLGLSGAGKTTTFKCITQEISKDNGEIFINGENITGNFNKLNEIFGYCPEFFALYEYLTVYENLEFYARIKGIKQNKISQLVNGMINEIALEEFRNKLAGKLSRGNQRKLSVAIAMIGNPPVLLLDEPSSGIDPEARRFMWSIIHKMSTKGEKSSVLISTHSMEEVETLCKRIGFMVNGEFICVGRPSEIKEKYGYGYEINIRIKPIDEKLEQNILNQVGYNKNLFVEEKNIEQVLNNLGKRNYFNELREGRLGERIYNALYLKGKVSIVTLINWIFSVENAFKFIQKGKEFFEEIILIEHFENNFVFKLRKGNEPKSIGFFFGLFEQNKDKCHVSEYSIQLTSLEQIFNKLSYQYNKNGEKTKENGKDIPEENNTIVIDDILLNNLYI